MVQYRTAFNRPLDIGKSVIGLILSFIPVLNLLVRGYFLQCAYFAVYRKFEMPRWSELPELFIDGLIFLIIQTVYYLPLLISLVFFANIISSFFAMDIYSATIISDMWSSLKNIGLVAAILAFLAAYLTPAAVLNYKIYGRFSQAFNMPAILRLVINQKYLSSWLVGTLYILAPTALILFAFSTITIHPLILLVLIYLTLFITRVTFYTLIGNTYAEIYQQSKAKFRGVIFR